MLVPVLHTGSKTVVLYFSTIVQHVHRRDTYGYEYFRMCVDGKQISQYQSIVVALFKEV